MTKKIFYTLSLTFLFFINIISCYSPIQNNFSTEEIIFTLPPCDFFNNQRIIITEWKIQIQSENYAQIYFIPASQTKIPVAVTKNSPLSITATPVTTFQNPDSEKQVFFKPAGAIYPYDFVYNFDNQIPLRWENGYVAFLMQQLFKSNETRKETSDFIQSFNWKKMENVIVEKIENSRINLNEDKSFFYNPWLCNSEKILQSISTRKFQISLLSDSQCSKCELKNLNLQGYNIYSSFIPENQVIQTKNIVTINSSNTNLFIGRNFGLILTVSSAKNVSSAIVNLPIFLKEL